MYKFLIKYINQCKIFYVKPRKFLKKTMKVNYKLNTVIITFLKQLTKKF